MKILVFGATGRIGSSVVDQAVASGHTVAAFVRDRSRLKTANLTAFEGNVLDSAAVEAVLRNGFDAVVVAIGSRYLGVTGTAEMPRKSVLGNLSTFILRLTPVGNAIRDHDGAFSLVSKSALDWTLAACPWVKDGPARGNYKTSLTFPGGNKFIYPADVAHFFVRELTAHTASRQVVGIWY